jgi:hypothetical protein
MQDLVQFTIDAHGGLARFERFSTLTARLHQAGILWNLKGQPSTLEDAQVRVDLKEQRVSHWPFAPTRNRSTFRPNRVAIESPDGAVVEQLQDPRTSFSGFAMETHWTAPQLAYFAGYTMWTYLTTPFILRRPGVVSREIEPWSENGETWRRLRVRFPEEIATHSTEQTFFIDERGLVRRHDYEVEIQGNNAAARYLLDHVEVSGIILPGRFRVYPRNHDDSVLREPVIVAVDLSDYRFDAA